MASYIHGAASRCRCGQTAYLTRTDAKTAKRRHNLTGKRVYACQINHGVFHIGDLAPQVVAGEVTREEVYGMEDAEKWARELVIARAYRLCEVCGGMGYEFSHRQTRAVSAGHRWCPCNGIYSCRTCHAKMHAGPQMARYDGLHVSRFEPVPGTIPVLLSVGWAILDCEGGGKVIAEADVIHEYGIPRLRADGDPIE